MVAPGLHGMLGQGCRTGLCALAVLRCLFRLPTLLNLLLQVSQRNFEVVWVYRKPPVLQKLASGSEETVVLVGCVVLNGEIVSGPSVIGNIGNPKSKASRPSGANADKPCGDSVDCIGLFASSSEGDRASCSTDCMVSDCKLRDGRMSRSP